MMVLIVSGLGVNEGAEVHTMYFAVYSVPLPVFHNFAYFTEHRVFKCFIKIAFLYILSARAMIQLMSHC